jgi:hypothetical protein
LAIPGFLAVLLWLFSGRRNGESPSPEGRVILTLLGLTVVQTIIVLAWYEGWYRSPASARLYLLPSVVATLSPIVLYAFVKGKRAWAKTALWSVTIASALLYRPNVVDDRFMRSLIVRREFDFVRSFLEQQPDTNLLLISDRPGQTTIFNMGAVDFRYANQNAKRIEDMARRHLWKRTYVVQRIAYSNLQPIETHRWELPFQLTTLAELQTDASHFLRISQAVPIPLSKEPS